MAKLKIAADSVVGSCASAQERERESERDVSRQLATVPGQFALPGRLLCEGGVICRCREQAKDLTPSFPMMRREQIISSKLVLGQFLKFRNNESRFLERNQFIYSMKIAKQMEWQAFRSWT